MNKAEHDFPLTQSQLSLLTGQQLHPGIPLHNAVYTFDIKGQLNTVAFKTAFSQLIAQTDVLRTQFKFIAGEPYQSIRDNISYGLEVHNFDNFKEDVDLEEYINNRAQKPLQLNEQVFDSILIKVKDDRYIWFLNLHHVITDAVTFAILYRQMQALYRVALQNTTPQSKNRPEYRAYATYEKQQLSQPENIAHIQYWSEKAQRRSEPLKLYGVAHDKKSTKAVRLSAPLENHRRQLLATFVENQDYFLLSTALTEFSILASVYALFLHRISNQEQLTFGIPIHSRTSLAFKQTAGLFVEVFPMQIEVKSDDTFITLLDRVQSNTLEILRHAKSGLLTPETSGHYNTVLNYIQADFGDFHGMQTSTNWVHPGHMDSAHTLRCHFYDFNNTGELTVVFDMNTAVFNPPMQTQLPIHFLRLFDAVLKQPDSLVVTHSLVDQDELRSLLIKGPVTQAPDTTVLEIFERQVSARPNAIVLQSGDTTLTYGQLNKRANQLAHYLIEKNINPNARVGLHLQRSPDYIIGVLAILKAGASFIPIASDQPKARISYISRDSNCRLVLTCSKLVDQIDANLVGICNVSEEKETILKQPTTKPECLSDVKDAAYILYTSGSTGNPKGVLISNAALFNYLVWAKDYYRVNEQSIFPFFTTIGFDLSITTTFLPLCNGGRMIIYPEPLNSPDLSIISVIEQNEVNIIKLTPSHLMLLEQHNLSNSQLQTIIVGGEDFKSELAKAITDQFSKPVTIFNEYGPTEATVGCIVSKYTLEQSTGLSLPIGKPIANMQAMVLDRQGQFVVQGLPGELYVSGIGLANKYVNNQELTDEKFIPHPFEKGLKMYRTGDMARLNQRGDFEYLGRIDDQIKLRGHRIELAEIEANLQAHPAIDHCTVVVVTDNAKIPESELVNCIKCGLPSNYPEIEFNDIGVCQLCTAFPAYQDKVKQYFNNDEALVQILTSKRGISPNYDCISLLSGGKDSTYVLGRLLDMGLKVLAFTLDNGYISDQAKENIQRIVTKFKVDHIYGHTPFMNEIFVDSLHRHHNVCNGCFKTIYTLSTQIALEKQIPFIVTGLSRGQFFETRLTEELFQNEVSTTDIDNTILEARKLYHRESDAVKRLLDVSAFDDDAVFEKVQYIDFYRYSDVSLEELLVYLRDKIGWVRPSDTGRSTNCLINQVGIFVHKKEEGYSNYAFPYSWDVRLGHKTRNESLDEINEVIDQHEVKRIMSEIGYKRSSSDALQSEKLVAYFTGNEKVSIKALTEFLSTKLPQYMIPAIFKPLEALPLTKNGKLDKKSLQNLSDVQLTMSTPYTAPRNDIETLLEDIWKEVLQLKKIGVYDNFVTLGGHSLAAIRVTARINDQIQTYFQLSAIFEHPTIAEYGNFIEAQLIKLMGE